MKSPQLREELGGSLLERSEGMVCERESSWKLSFSAGLNRIVCRVAIHDSSASARLMIFIFVVVRNLLVTFEMPLHRMKPSDPNGMREVIRGLTRQNY
jgi:hypothetical protein